MKFTLLAAKGVLLTVLCCSSVLSAATTVRPYKFGFTVEEQQHRQESRDERGIVTGEFGFITADGKYHVTVYATDENGKFRIVSMKSFPYAGPISPNAVPAATALTTTSSKPPAEPTKHSFYSEGCAGCFLKQSTPAPPAQAVPATSSSTLGAFASPAVLVASSPSLAAGHAKSPSGNRGTKTEIRPLSLPLTPTAADAPDNLDADSTSQRFTTLYDLQQHTQTQLQAQQSHHATPTQEFSFHTNTIDKANEPATLLHVKQSALNLLAGLERVPPAIAGHKNFNDFATPVKSSSTNLPVHSNKLQLSAQDIQTALAGSTQVLTPEQVFASTNKASAGPGVTQINHIHASANGESINYQPSLQGVLSTAQGFSNPNKGLNRQPSLQGVPQGSINKDYANNKLSLQGSPSATQGLLHLNNDLDKMQPSTQQDSTDLNYDLNNLQPTSQGVAPPRGHVKHTQSTFTNPQPQTTNPHKPFAGTPIKADKLNLSKLTAQSIGLPNLPIDHANNLLAAQQNPSLSTATSPHQTFAATPITANKLNLRPFSQTNRDVVNSMSNIVLPVSNKLQNIITQHKHIPQAQIEAQVQASNDVLHSMNNIVLPVTHKIGNAILQPHRHPTQIHAHHNINTQRPSHSVVGTKPGQAPNSPDHTKSGHASNSPGDTKFGQAPNAVVGNAGNLNTPTLTTTIEQKQRQPPAGGLASTTSKGSALFGQAATAEEIGDLYKFKYLLDYNGHEETGSRNGNKQGKYFSISDDAVQHTVEYIANEFGFQPHVSWRKLTAEEANLPAENGLKHYEFKWFKLPE